MVQGGMTCIKYLMFFFNFLFVVCGIILIVVGAVVSSRDVTYFLGSKYLSAPVILIIVGIVIFLLAFLGCCGAVKENSCMVTTFGVLLFLVFVLEVAGGVTAYVYRGTVQNGLKDAMNETLRQQKPDGIKVFNDIQQNFKCCGVDGPNDYSNNNVTIPKSCCGKKAESCSDSSDDLQKTGCYDSLLHELKKYSTLAGGVAIGIAVVELLGVLMAWCLSSAIKKEYEGV